MHDRRANAALRFIDRVAPNHWGRDLLIQYAEKILTGDGSEATIKAAEMMAVMLPHHDQDNLAFYAFYEAVKENTLHPNCFSAILASAWTGGKVIGPLSNFTYRLRHRMFEFAVPEFLMTPEDLAVFNALPDEITVYRGALTNRSANHVRYGMSWTLNREVANIFAMRNADPDFFKDCIPILLMATAKKEHVFAYFNDREEEEVVIRSGRVRRVIALPTEPLSSKPQTNELLDELLSEKRQTA